MLPLRFCLNPIPQAPRTNLAPWLGRVVWRNEVLWRFIPPSAATGSPFVNPLLKMNGASPYFSHSAKVQYLRLFLDSEQRLAALCQPSHDIFRTHTVLRISFLCSSKNRKVPMSVKRPSNIEVGGRSTRLRYNWMSMTRGTCRGCV